MLSIEDNKLLTEVGPGTPMGDLLRRYWHPVCALDELLAEPLPHQRADDPGRRAGGLSRPQRAAGADRSAVRAPPRQPGLRRRRGGRPALPVPRLEVRPDRQLHRAALRGHDPPRRQLPRQVRHPGLPGAGAGRPGLRLHGPAAGAAAAALGPAGLGQLRPRHRHRGAALQLAAVPGELAGPGPHRVAAQLRRRLLPPDPQGRAADPAATSASTSRSASTPSSTASSSAASRWGRPRTARPGAKATRCSSRTSSSPATPTRTRCSSACRSTTRTRCTSRCTPGRPRPARRRREQDVVPSREFQVRDENGQYLQPGRVLQPGLPVLGDPGRRRQARAGEAGRVGQGRDHVPQDADAAD